MSYAESYAASLANAPAFWARAAQDIEWVRRPRAILKLDDPRHPSWFPGAMLNTCYNAVDLHVVSGRGDQTALIFETHQGESLRFSYRELLARVSQLAGVLAGLGVERGDRVMLVLPNLPETVFGMLACARIGAVHCVAPAALGANELTQRIQLAAPKLILTASCALDSGRVVPCKPLLDEAIAGASSKPEHCLVLQRPEQGATLLPGRDLDWQATLREAPAVSAVPLQAGEALYLLHTAGTTGSPKAVVRDQGGHAVALKWNLSRVHGVQPGDVVWALSDLDAALGHAYAVYGPLFLGCTTVVREETPPTDALVPTLDRYGVAVLIAEAQSLAAAAVPSESPPPESLRSLVIGGEKPGSDFVRDCQRSFGAAILEAWWQTETGGPIAAPCVGLGADPIPAGAVGAPVPGYAVHVVDDEGKPLAAGEIGHLVLALPLPPGCLRGLWQNDAAFESRYFARFPGCYETGDAGSIDADGQISVLARSADLISVAGRQLAAGPLEAMLTDHPDVAAAAIVEIADPDRANALLGFAERHPAAQMPSAELEEQLVARLQRAPGSASACERVVIVERLPRTRGGHLLRGLLRKLASGQMYRTPATIDDPAIPDQIRRVLEARDLRARS